MPATLFKSTNVNAPTEAPTEAPFSVQYSANSAGVMVDMLGWSTIYDIWLLDVVGSVKVVEIRMIQLP